MENGDLASPATASNYIRQDRVECNIYTCLLVCLYLAQKFGCFRVIKVDTAIGGSRGHQIPIQTEIALDRETRDTMTFVSLVLVKFKWWSGREYSYVVSMGLCNKIWLKWVASYTRACVSFCVNLGNNKSAV